MTAKETLLREVDDVSEDLLTEVIHYVRFLKSQRDQIRGVAILGETSLAKDWLRPEEDEAWKDL